MDVHSHAHGLRPTTYDDVLGWILSSYDEFNTDMINVCSIVGENGVDTLSVTAVKTDSSARTDAPDMSPTRISQKEIESEPKVREDHATPALKRKASVVMTPGPAEKRAKQEAIEISDDDEGTKATESNKTTSKQKNTRGKTSTSTKTAHTTTMSDEPKLPESESEDDTGEDESEYDDDANSDDPQIAKKITSASKSFESACRSCKINAKKVLKDKYELQISKLKSEHKQELRSIKANGANTLAETKSKATKEKREQKDKYEGHIKELKAHRDKKMAEMKEKHTDEIESWEEKHDENKGKITALRGQRDAAEAKRKEAEKSAADEVKAANNDLKAGEKALREQKRQYMREKQEEIDILKPEHSKIVKDNAKVIKEMTNKIMKLEQDVESAEYSLRRVTTDYQALQQQHQNLKVELKENQKRNKQVEKDLNDAKKFATGVEGRTDTKLARLQEKLELQESNTREHTNSVITLTRENFRLRDTLSNVAKLGREKREEVERLKAELESTKAELGVIKGMEEGADELDQQNSSAQIAAPSAGLISFD